jgi:hypothetical protein
MTEGQPGEHDPDQGQGRQASDDHDSRDCDRREQKRQRGDSDDRVRAGDRDRARPAPNRASAWQIGDDGIELAVGAGAQGGAESLLELFGREAAFGGRGAKSLSDVLSIGVGCPQVSPLCHLRVLLDRRLTPKRLARLGRVGER